jgi:hypothetical protein
VTDCTCDRSHDPLLHGFVAFTESDWGGGSVGRRGGGGTRQTVAEPGDVQAVAAAPSIELGFGAVWGHSLLVTIAMVGGGTGGAGGGGTARCAGS